MIRRYLKPLGLLLCVVALALSAAFGTSSLINTGRADEYLAKALPNGIGKNFPVTSSDSVKQTPAVAPPQLKDQPIAYNHDSKPRIITKTVPLTPHSQYDDNDRLVSMTRLISEDDIVESNSRQIYGSPDISMTNRVYSNGIAYYIDTLNDWMQTTHQALVLELKLDYATQSDFQPRYIRMTVYSYADDGASLAWDTTFFNFDPEQKQPAKKNDGKPSINPDSGSDTKDGH